MAEENKTAVPKVTTPGYLANAFMQAGNGVFMGYLPEIVEALPGSHEGDAEKLRQGLAQGWAANPKTSLAMRGAGMLSTGGVAKAAAGKALSLVPGLVSTTAGKAGWALAAARAKDLWANGTTLAKMASPLAAGIGLSQFIGADEKAPDPAAVREAAGLPPEAAPADAQVPAGAQVPAPPKLSAQDQQYVDDAALVGITDPDLAVRIGKRGMLPSSMVQQSVAQSQRHAPTYKDLAFSRYMDSVAEAETDARSIRDPAQRSAAIAAVRSRANAMLLQMLGPSVQDQQLQQANDSTAP